MGMNETEGENISREKREAGPKKCFERYPYFGSQRGKMKNKKVC